MINNGYWLEARPIASPNFNARPEGAEISLLVIHCISLPPGEFGNHYVEDFFLNRLDADAHPYFATIADIHVSAHVFIKRNGDAIQFVSFNDRAWHAGRSEFNGQVECNDYSIGVELEGTDTGIYAPAQYKTLTRLTKALMTHYPNITADRITGHEHIAPQRKTDPGTGFDWTMYKNSI